MNVRMLPLFAKGRFKRWFNRRYPYRRICVEPWCWRGQTYQYRCEVHNRCDFKAGDHRG